MDLQFNDHNTIQLDERKFSQNTCASSSNTSPNSDPNDQQNSSIKSLKAFSTGSPSPHFNHSPDKAFQTWSISTLPSLQNRPHGQLSSESICEGSSEKTISNQMEYQMEEENVENGKNLIQIEGEESDKNLLGSGLKEANIKSLELARQNRNLNMVSELQSGCKQNSHHLTQSTNSDNVQSNAKNLSSSSPQSQTTSTTSTSVKDTRPLPSYPQARPALYTWIRNLCLQMNMCLDVFALTMRYLDEYHLTHGHPYNRYTFTINAYGMIILASKMMSKQILTPRLIAEKIFVTKEQMESIEMGLIRMMNFQVYFETWVKQLQKKMEKWEEVIERAGLKQQLTLFGENIHSFKRLYCIMREVELMAKTNYHITQRMFLSAFIKALSGQFKTDYRASIFLSEILCEVFAQIIQQNPIEFNHQAILNQINNQIDEQDNGDIWNKMKENFERKDNKELFQNYNVFLNSIFVMKV